MSLRGLFGSYDDAVFGSILIFIMLFAPDGILRLPFLHKLKKQILPPAPKADMQPEKGEDR
jgi:branched-chain amino acid transport system permease protein